MNRLDCTPPTLLKWKGIFNSSIVIDYWDSLPFIDSTVFLREDSDVNRPLLSILSLEVIGLAESILNYRDKPGDSSQLQILSLAIMVPCVDLYGSLSWEWYVLLALGVGIIFALCGVNCGLINWIYSLKLYRSLTPRFSNLVGGALLLYTKLILRAFWAGFSGVKFM